MTVEEHYARWLQLPPPWEATRVEESLAEQRVTVFLRWPDGVRARCPECVLPPIKRTRVGRG